MIKEAIEEIKNTNFERDLNAPIDEERIEGLKKVLNLSCLKILECGCLDGYHTVQLAKTGCDIITSDIRPDNLKKTLYRCLYEKIYNIKFMLLDVEDMHNEIVTDEFDLLFCSGLIYHLFMPHEFLYNIRKHFKYIFLEGHISNPEKYGPMYQLIFMGQVLDYNNYSEAGYNDPQSAKNNTPSKWFTEKSWHKIFDICNLKLKSVIYNDIKNEHGLRVCYLLERR